MMEEKIGQRRCSTMYFKQFYLSCLSHASYLLGSDGEAAVVDPQRDIDQYLTEAHEQGFNIKYVIETHLHADFVSGHQELATRTGAEIVFGAKAGASFPHRAVQDGDELRIGKVVLRILETPGHTPEGICVLVIDTDVSDQPQKILTGDTLFIGDVGRPDLAGSRGYTPEMMAAMLYDSLHQKILTLADNVEVYPAHGAGSMCGRNISRETSSTIGEQRKFNYALKPMARDEFVQLLTANLPEAPAYFSQDAEINRSGAPALDALVQPAALSPEEFHKLKSENYVVLDVRSAGEFGAGHVPGSINIGLGGQFAMWAGSLIPLNTPIIVVVESGAELNEAVMRLSRVGIESVKGYLSGGFEEWINAGFEIASVPQITVEELKELMEANSELQILDVRRPSEYASGHAPAAVTAPLSNLRECLSSTLKLDPKKKTAVLCAGGYRSSAATSLLEQAGFADVYNVTGGTSAWINAGFPVELPAAEKAPELRE
jgi:hydroxyacylglutathione hydrolase